MSEQQEPEVDPVLRAAASERRAAPADAGAAADLADKYDRMLRLAALFDDSGEELRRRAGLGQEIVHDPAFTESIEASRPTAAAAEQDILHATGSTGGLLSRSVELDADALVLRATVLTYRWIDELQAAAYQTIGAIAGRAIGYLAPQVALGGAVVAAGLIETDALDRDGVAAYLSELAEANPELMEHVTSGGGGLLDGLRMRSLLTVGFLAGDDGHAAGRAGLRSIGVDPVPTAFSAALRDVAGGMVERATEHPDGAVGEASAPRNLTELMSRLEQTRTSVEVHRIGPGRFIAYLPGPTSGRPGHLRLVGGDGSSYAGHVLRTISQAVGDEADPHLMLVGVAQGGVVAAEVAAAADHGPFSVDQVVTAGAPSAHVPRIAEPTRVLSLEDRSDPVALLGSLINADVTNRVTVVFDGAEGLEEPAATHGDDAAEARAESLAVCGGRAADASDHPGLRAEIERLQRLGYLAG